MLQKYSFVRTQDVHKLQSEISTFIHLIRHVKSTDVFDPDVYLNPDFATKVKRRHKGVPVKIFTLLNDFFNKYKALGVRKIKVFNAFVRMNDVQNLFDKRTGRITIDNIPPQIQKETLDLFYFLYENTLTDYNIHKHYEDFYTAQGNNWCPFCGMEKLLHFTHQKQDYDHLLPKSKYPFAAINMRNLAPMGHNCNSVYKKTKDLIWDDKKQIKAVNPYNKKINVKLDFTNTTLPKRGDDKGVWDIKFLPDCDEVKRWKFVYCISDRIVKDYLAGKTSDYQSWLDLYLGFVRSRTDLKTLKQVRASFISFGSQFDNHRYRECNYLKADLFKWIGNNAPEIFIKSFMDTINNVKINP